VLHGAAPSLRGPHQRRPPQPPAVSVGRSKKKEHFALTQRAFSSHLGREPRARKGPAERGPLRSWRSSGDDAEDLTLGEDHQILTFDDDLGPTVLGEDDAVPLLDVERNPLPFVVRARTHGEDDALLGLLLRSVRDDEARRQRLVAVVGTNKHSISEWP